MCVCAGLLRFLQLLQRHPWAARPLVVDPDQQLTAAQHRAAQEAFNASRAAGGAASMPALFIVTPRDLRSTHWCAFAVLCMLGGRGPGQEERTAQCTVHERSN